MRLWCRIWTIASHLFGGGTGCSVFSDLNSFNFLWWSRNNFLSPLLNYEFVFASFFHSFSSLPTDWRSLQESSCRHPIRSVAQEGHPRITSDQETLESGQAYARPAKGEDQQSQGCFPRQTEGRVRSLNRTAGCTRFVHKMCASPHISRLWFVFSNLLTKNKRFDFWWPHILCALNVWHRQTWRWLVRFIFFDSYIFNLNKC